MLGKAFVPEPGLEVGPVPGQKTQRTGLPGLGDPAGGSLRA